MKRFIQFAVLLVASCCLISGPVPVNARPIRDQHLAANYSTKSDVILWSSITYEATHTSGDCLKYGDDTTTGTCHNYKGYLNQIVPDKRKVFISHVSFWLGSTITVDKSNCKFMLEYGPMTDNVEVGAIELLVMGDGTSLETIWDHVVTNPHLLLTGPYWWHIRVDEAIVGECTELYQLQVDVLGRYY